MSRRDLLWLFACGVALASLVAALGALDARRAEGQLAVLRDELCAARVPPRLLAPLDRLFDEARRRRTDARALVERIGARVPAGDRELRLFFESDAALWTASPGSGARLDGALHWPRAVGRWEEVAWSVGCRGVRSGAVLIAARTLRTPKGRFAVLVAERRRDRE